MAEQTNSEFATTSTTALTLGQKLRQAREGKKYSLSEVSQNLLISKKIIESLENNDFSSIVALVYAKGYLKAYAKYLQLPENEVLADFEKMKIYDKDEKSIVVASDQEALKIKNYVQIATFTIFSILIILVLIWAFSQRLANKNTTEIQSVTEVNQVNPKATEETNEKEKNSGMEKAAMSSTERSSLTKVNEDSSALTNSEVVKEKGKDKNKEDESSGNELVIPIPDDSGQAISEDEKSN